MPGPSGTEVGAVTIRVSPDTSKFRKELERELKAISKGVSIEIPVKLDAKGVRAQLAAIKKTLGDIGGANINITADTKSLESSMRATTTHAISLRTAFAKVKEGIADATKEAKNLKEHVQRFAGTAHTVATQNPFKSIWQGSRTLGKSIIDLDFNMKRFHKTGKLASQTLQAGFTGAGKAAGTLLDLTTLGVRHFGDLGRVAKIAVAVIAGLPVILGVVGGLLAGLPALAAATGAGIGVIALGMDGIKKAGEGFGKAIQPLRDSISKIFEKRLGEQMQGFAGVLNKMKPQLQAVTNGLLDMSQGFFDSFKSAQGMESMNQILSGTASLFHNLQPAMQNFTTGFLSLAAGGAKNFDLLSGVINKFASSFKTMVDQMIGSGELRDMFKGLAAVTDSLLQGFLKLFRVGAQALGQLGGPLANALTSIVDLVVDLVPALIPIAKLILDVVGAFAEALRPAIKAITPSIEIFAKAVGSAIVPALQAMAPILQEVAVFIGEFLEALTPLMPVLLEVARAVMDIFLEAFRALKPVMPIIIDLIKDLAQMITTALKDAMPTLIQIAKLLGEAFLVAIKALAPILPQLVKAFLDLVQAALPLLPPLLQLAIEVLPPLVDLFKAVAGPVIDLAKWIMSLLVPALTFVIGVVKDVIIWFANLLKGVVEAAVGLFQWFRDLPGKIWSMVKDAANWLWETGKNIVRGIVNGIWSIAQDVWNFFIGLPGRIWDLVKDAGRWLIDAGKKIIMGLVEGMTDMMPALKNIMTKVRSQTQGNLFSEFKINSPSRLMIPIGRFITQGIAVGMEDGIKFFDDPISNMAERIQSEVTGFSTSIDTSADLTSSFDSVDGAVERALSNWSIQMDAQGLAKLVRNANLKNNNGR